MAESNITGGKELDELLKSLPLKIEKNIMRSALRAGAVVLLAEARANVPRKSNALYKSLRVSTRLRKGQVTASVKAGNRVVYYALMVEFGTRAHIEKPKAGVFMNVAGSPRKVVNHPGAAPHPFMRPAADTKFQEATRTITNTLRARLTAEGLNAPPPLPPDDNEGAP